MIHVAADVKGGKGGADLCIAVFRELIQSCDLPLIDKREREKTMRQGDDSIVKATC